MTNKMHQWKRMTGAALWFALLTPLSGHAFLASATTWPAGEITFDVDFADGQFDDAFEQAAAEWTNRSTFRVTVNKDTPGGAACSGTAGSRNGSIFNANACGSGYGSTTLAIAFSQSIGGERVWAGITFRDDRTWEVYSGALTSNPEFRRVAVHEIGHAIGLKHADDASAPSASQALCTGLATSLPIMCSTAGLTEIPEADDIAGVASLYDTDNDGVGLYQDNCPDAGNAAQADSDGDLIGDTCDDDIDGDGIFNANASDQGYANATNFFRRVLRVSGGETNLLGQVVTTGVGGDLVAVELPISCNQADLVVTIEGVTPLGLPDGVIANSGAATTTVSGATLAAATGFVRITLSSPVSFTAGQQFAIVTDVTNQTDPTNSTHNCSYSIGAVEDGYSGGDGAFRSSNNSDNWVKFSTFAPAPEDLPFSTIVAPAVLDNCPSVSNANQNDLDTDGQGDVCDDDSDGDTMPNTFENANGLNPLDASDALTDLDNDGSSNLEEFTNGTDVNDPSDGVSPYRTIVPILRLLFEED
ncbi:MAG: matrixin family metalloprotease [Chromatiales bacterium]|nr:matrixin family metalloprotease [Chromatiales bacterium]